MAEWGYCSYMRTQTTTAAPAGSLTRKGLISMMETTTAREDCVLFAATYPTANVRRAVELAESGQVTWEQVADLFKKALVAGLAA